MESSVEKYKTTFGEWLGEVGEDSLEYDLFINRCCIPKETEVEVLEMSGIDYALINKEGYCAIVDVDDDAIVVYKGGKPVGGYYCSFRWGWYAASGYSVMESKDLYSTNAHDDEDAPKKWEEGQMVVGNIAKDLLFDRY